MDIIFNNGDLLETFSIALIKLDIKKDLIYDLMYHIYNVHQSNKCTLINLLFPKSKETCDELIFELSTHYNQDIVEFVANLKNKIKDEPFDRNIDAVAQARKIFAEINSQIIVDLSFTELDTHQFKKCQEFEKELILYQCLPVTEREKYFQNKHIRPEFRKKINSLYRRTSFKCNIKLFEKITKKNKFEPVIWHMRRNCGDDIIFACGDQRKRMDIILNLIQKVYL